MSSILAFRLPINSVEDQVNMLFLWVLLVWLLGVSIFSCRGTISIYLYVHLSKQCRPVFSCGDVFVCVCTFEGPQWNAATDRASG